jgi:hypothetical protein
MRSHCVSGRQFHHKVLCNVRGVIATGTGITQRSAKAPSEGPNGIHVAPVFVSRDGPVSTGAGEGQADFRHEAMADAVMASEDKRKLKRLMRDVKRMYESRR